MAFFFAEFLIYVQVVSGPWRLDSAPQKAQCLGSYHSQLKLILAEGNLQCLEDQPFLMAFIVLGGPSCF